MSEGKAEPLLTRPRRHWNAPRQPRVAGPGRIEPAKVVASPASATESPKEKSGSRIGRLRAGRTLAGPGVGVAGVGGAALRAGRGPCSAGGGRSGFIALRFKAGWPQRAAARRAERVQAAALQGVCDGSVVCDAVSGAAAAVKRAVAGVASAARSGAAEAACINEAFIHRTQYFVSMLRETPHLMRCP